MFKLIGYILRWLQGETLKLFCIAGSILIVWGIVSPVGTLIWWLGQSAQTLGLQKDSADNFPSEPIAKEPLPSASVTPPSPLSCYIIFLPGVGDFSANELTPGEEFFLKSLVDFHPNCIAVGDVFPYSAANKSLGGQRFLAPVWRFAEQAKWRKIQGDVLIKIRNLWRFAISLDYRYGPVYNQGIATAIIERMQAKHPFLRTGERPLKIILIGTSGGVQVALGATPYLKHWLNHSEISVVSIGGVFSGKNGFNEVDRIYHLRGRRDAIEDIGGIIFPSRWPWFVGSAFNQARYQGRYSALVSGPQKHDGSQGYFGQDRAKNGQTYVEITLQQVNQLPIWPERKTQ
ncbi:MAG: hypothetical protein ACM37W_18495 [Actinomycetota bacterium]